MSKKLGIKGHETRGKEIIELLEMMGGINKNMLSAHIGDVLNPHVYFLEPDSSDNRIVWNYLLGLEWDGRASDMMIFTLEEFLDKYPFKVGDKVYMKVDPNENCLGYDKIYGEIESAMWVEKFGYVVYKLKDSSGIFHREDLHPYEEESKGIVITDKNHKMGPKSKLPSKYYEEIQTKREYDELRMPLDDDDKLATEVTIMDKKILPPDGYLVGKITQTDNGMLVEYVEKKPKYPTTYAECCEVLVGRKPKPNEISFDKMELCLVDLDNTQSIDFQNPYLPQFNSLFRLRMCRDAYWKIYGEEAGLGKPWKPDWNEETNKFTISNKCNKIYLNNTAWYAEVLSFPTEEMRDIFYKNFKNLIEECKELL